MKRFTIICVFFLSWIVPCIDAEDEICPTLKLLRNVGLVRAKQVLSLGVAEYSTFHSHFLDWMVHAVNYPNNLQVKEEECNDEKVIADFEQVKKLLLRVMDRAYELQLQTCYDALTAILDSTAAPIKNFLASGKPPHHLGRTQLQMMVMWQHWRPIVTKLEKLCRKNYHYSFHSKLTKDALYIGQIPTNARICNSSASKVAHRLTREIENHPFWSKRMRSTGLTLDSATPEMFPTSTKKPKKNGFASTVSASTTSASTVAASTVAASTTSAFTLATAAAASSDFHRKRKGSVDGESRSSGVSSPSQSLHQLFYTEAKPSKLDHGIIIK